MYLADDEGVPLRWVGDGGDGKVHAVYAAGGPADGSLYGFETGCHIRIRRVEDWQELPVLEGSVNCRHCINVVLAFRRRKRR